MRTFKQRSAKRAGLLAALLATCLLGIGAASASADVKWEVTSAANTTVAPGDGDASTAELSYWLGVWNVGDSASTGEPIILTGTLPAGVTFVAMSRPEGFDCSSATPGDSTFSCVSTEIVGANNPSFNPRPKLEVSLAPSVAPLFTSLFEVSGGGAPSPDTTVDPTRASASAPSFGIDAFDVVFGASPAGGSFTQAGGHPYVFRTSVDFNTNTDPDPYYGEVTPVEPARDAYVDLPPGLVGNPTVAGRCTLLQLSDIGHFLTPGPQCPTNSQVGTATIRYLGGPLFGVTRAVVPLFSMEPPPGAAARFGFNVLGVPVVFDAKLRTGGDYGLTVAFEKISEGLTLIGSEIELWGVPGDSRHNPQRACPGGFSPMERGPTCPAGAEPQAFLRMPTTCTAPGQGLAFHGKFDSWDNPGALGPDGLPAPGDPNWKPASVATHEPPGYPASPEDPSTPWGNPIGTTGCDEVPVKGRLSAVPSALDTESSSGLAVHVEIPNAGIENPKGIASSDIEGVKLTLPQGLTINPSQSEGLGVCSSAQYESTELSFHPDGSTGCPSDSKVGTVSVKTPLLEEALPGEVYVAKPHDNPFNSLLAIYVVISEPQRGIQIKLAGEIALNETTGRIETEFSDLPQLPFDSFDFRFREGARAPLVTPPRCGTYESEAVFTPWSDPSKKLTSTSSFQITRGIGGGPCPDGAPGFDPGFSAGSINNSAGSFSEFVMRLTRNDGEQDMTKFSSILPPGVSAKIAGVSKCSNAAIAAAAGKTGLQERANPSCPASSQIGRTLVGAGVGSVLTQVPGQLYLAGPYKGSPLSVVSITPAVAGPFDVGVVVVREALSLDPVTAEVHVDGDKSDPIPHILEGIPLKLRDLRVYVDRDRFTINPTSCDPSSVRATLFGSGLDVFNPADDVPVALSSRYQAANCAALGFKPKLKIKLRGGTKRGDYPGLRAVVTPRKGDANIDGATVTLPRSAFLEQGHIRTICTRVQFAADSCPPAAIYGKVKAWTPLLDEPLSGPVYLRSSSNKLPDLVFDLKGIVDIEVPGRIDSVNGGIRASFKGVPDAPISRVVLTMQGGKKGLIVNSANLCAAKKRAKALFSGQNGKRREFKPVVGAQCGKKRKRGGKRK